MKIEKILPPILAVIVVAVMSVVVFTQTKGMGEEEYRIVCLGDSIIGNVRDESSVTAVMESVLGEPVANCAFGGTCASLGNSGYRSTFYEDSVNLAMLADSIVSEDFAAQMYDIASNNFKLDYFLPALQEMDKIDFDKVEILFIEHGVNDYSGGRPIDNPDNPLDVYTYAGALRYSIEQIQDRYPDVQIVLVTPLYCYFQKDGEKIGDCETSDFGQGPLVNYVDAQIKVADEYGISVIDNFHNLGINKDNIDEFAIDGIHLNEKGRQLLAKALAEYVIVCE